MRQYKLAKGKKATTCEGIADVIRGGVVVGTEYPVFKFRPGVIVSVPDGVDLGAWVDVGVIKEVEALKVVAAPAKEPAPVVEVPAVPSVPVEETDAVAVAPVEDVTDESDAGAKSDEDDLGFVERSDGGFECLHCGKVYSSGKRALEYVQSHIEKEHK